MPANPFEPPQTADLDRSAPPVQAPLAVSEEALGELIATAPAARWLTRLISLSIAVGLIEAAAVMTGHWSMGVKAGRLLSTAVGTGIATLFLIVLRRLATATERLRTGDTGARAEALAAQASYFKILGILALIAAGLLILGAGAGYLVGRMAAGR
jgi:hypothetical protein